MHIKYPPYCGNHWPSSSAVLLGSLIYLGVIWWLGSQLDFDWDNKNDSALLPWSLTPADQPQQVLPTGADRIAERENPTHWAFSSLCWRHVCEHLIGQSNSPGQTPGLGRRTQQDHRVKGVKLGPSATNSRRELKPSNMLKMVGNIDPEKPANVGWVDHKLGLQTQVANIAERQNRRLKIQEFMEYSLPGCSAGKASACSAGDPGLIPGLGRSPGEGNGNPLQYSCLKNPMDGKAC